MVKKYRLVYYLVEFISLFFLVVVVYCQGGAGKHSFSRQYTTHFVVVAALSRISLLLTFICRSTISYVSATHAAR